MSKPVELPEEKVEITTDGDKTTATVTVDGVDAVKAAIEAAAGERTEDNKDAPLNVVVNVATDTVSKPDAEMADATSVKLSADVVAALVEASKPDADGKATETIQVTVNSDSGTVTLPLAAILATQPKSDDPDNPAEPVDVELAVENVDRDVLTEELQTDGDDGKVVLDSNNNEVDMTGAVVVDVTLKVDDTAVPVKDLADEIQITAKAPDGATNVKVYFVKEDDGGNKVLEPVGAADQTYTVDKDGNVSFGVDHLTTFVVTEADATDPEHDCTTDGHEYVDGTCKWCGDKEVKDPEHDCTTDGHEYVDGTCKWCGDKEVKDPDLGSGGEEVNLS